MINIMSTDCHDARLNQTAWTEAATDWLERAAIVALYGWLVLRIFANCYAQGDLEGVAASAALLLSEGMVVFFILSRRKTGDVSRRPGQWLLAFAAVIVPLIVQPAGAGLALLPLGMGVSLMFIGMILQISAKLTLGRSMGCVPANRGLKLSGPYRLVRHPMYAGYLLTHAAFLAINPTLWNLAVHAIGYALQVPRLLAEARMLRGDSRYLQYAATVRYRLIPGIF
jgi:protein-S-isoprenylcysteine O-methyltransferase Ste14